MDIKNLRKQPTEALERNLQQARSHFHELRFKISTNQLKDVREIRETKKSIAQILTILKEKSTLK